MTKILLDTNVLLYSIDEDSKYFTAVKNILSKRNFDFFTSSKNLSEFLAVITRLPKNTVSTEIAIDLLEGFKNQFKILFPNSVSYNKFVRLLKIYSPTGLKIHDFEIVSIALAYDINTILTFNEKDFINIKDINLYPVTV